MPADTTMIPRENATLADHGLVPKRIYSNLCPPALLEHAIQICGTQTELARRLTDIEARRGAKRKIRTGHIYHWLGNGVPAERCPAIEQAVGGQVTRQQLRPDVFGPTPPAPAQEAG